MDTEKTYTLEEAGDLLAGPVALLHVACTLEFMAGGAMPDPEFVEDIRNLPDEHRPGYLAELADTVDPVRAWVAAMDAVQSEFLVAEPEAPDA